jgi:peptidoglycan/LPS O-acetylase OafA/YrhL
MSANPVISTSALAQTKAATRCQELDIARALAQFAVVLFHVPQYFLRYHVDSFSKDIDNLVSIVCPCLHIPTFMFVAGFLLAMTPGKAQDAAGYLRYEGKKFCRLMLPFAAISFLTLVVKMVIPEGTTSSSLSLRNVPAVLFGSVLTPRVGAAPHLWFLECLMGIFLVWPLLQWIVSDRRIALSLAALAVMAILPIPWPIDKQLASPLGLADLVTYLPIFALGFWYRKSVSERWQPGYGHLALAGTVLLGAILLNKFGPWEEGLTSATAARATRLLSYASGAICLVWLSGIINKRTRRFGTVLAVIGLYSYDIYLLHVVTAGHPIAVVVSRLHPGPVAVYAWFVIALVVTMFVPMGIGQVIRMFPRLAFVMLGVPVRRKPGPKPRA